MAPAPTRTHYDVLGISRDADAAEVRRAWKVLVQVWHPDRFSGEMAEEASAQVARINDAYGALRDSSRRAAYDCRLAADEASDERAAQAAAPRRQRPAVAHAAPNAAATATNVGVAAPRSLGEQLNDTAADLLAAVRRHPRIVGSAAAVWVLVFGGSLAMHLVAGPSLPGAGTASAAARSVSPVVASSPDAASDADVEQLDDLADEARAEARRAEAELAQLLEQDEAELAREQAAAAAAAAAAPRQPVPPARTAPTSQASPGARVQEITTADGRKVLRVLPTPATAP